MPPQPRKKLPNTHPLPTPPGKKLPAKGTGAFPKKGRKGKRKAKAPAWMPKLVVAGSVMAALVVLGALGAYLAQRPPAEAPAAAPANEAAVVRPSISPTVEGSEPQRPGLALAPSDEVYGVKAVDVAGTPLEGPVANLVGKGVLTVFADGRFRPEDALPRAEFVLWCYNAVMAQSVQGADPFVSPKKPISTLEATGEEYGDVPADHWAAAVLASVKGAGLLDPQGTAMFRPDEPLTRAEWLVMASRFASLPEHLATLSAPLDAKKLAVAYRAANYTDLEAVTEPVKPYVAFVFGDEKRSAWIGQTFQAPVTPEPWNPQKALTRGEAVRWIEASYNLIGAGNL